MCEKDFGRKILIRLGKLFYSGYKIKLTVSLPYQVTHVLHCNVLMGSRGLMVREFVGLSLIVWGETFEKGTESPTAHSIILLNEWMFFCVRETNNYFNVRLFLIILVPAESN